MMDRYLRMYRALRAEKLHVSNYMLLLVVRDGPMSAGAVARALEVLPAHMTRMIRRLEKHDFVERVFPDTDRRVVLLKLTPAGRKFLDEIERVKERGS
jgi:DNA-binding MarR family transcriptional regulator